MNVFSETFLNCYQEIQLNRQGSVSMQSLLYNFNTEYLSKLDH